MNEGYKKGTSENLPKVDLEMFMTYMSSSDCYLGVEMCGTKTLRSMRPNYGDSAIGYVQVKRTETVCNVQAKVTPEHKIRGKNYTVSAIINEEDETVVKCECHDCAASLGGCKHAVAFLAWLYRRTEEPSPTSVACYWQKPKLSSVGTNIKYKKISECVSNVKQNDTVLTDDQSRDFLKSVLNYESKSNSDSHLIKFFNRSTLQTLSLHYSAVSFSGDRENWKDFENWSATFLTSENCKSVSKVTVAQSESNLWYELRYGRITASKLYEAAQCQTTDGCLLESIMSMKNTDTFAMKRGRELESRVLQKVSTALKKQVKTCGLILNQKFPMLGASPDGLTDDAVIEIKCPSSDKNISRYYRDGQIQKKFKAQLHLQMLYAKKDSGYFCIADPEFEKTQKVTIIKEPLDRRFINSVIKNAVHFWRAVVFPASMKSVG